jgi:trigger factor
LPPADDDFAQLASEFDSLEELRQDLKAVAEKQAERDQVIEAQDKLLQHLLDTLDFVAPPGVVRADALAHLESHGESGDDPDVLAKYEAESAKEIRTELLADAIASLIKPRVSQADLVSYLSITAANLGMDPGMFARVAAESGELPHFYAEVSRNKSVLAALQQIVVVDSNDQVIDIAARLAVPAGTGAEDELAAELASADGDLMIDQNLATAALTEEVAIDLESLTEANKEG